MAPSCFSFGSKNADSRTDIYALGHILYQLAIGRNVWENSGWRQLEDFLRYLKQEPAPQEAFSLHDFRCDFYPNAKDVLSRMVRVWPHERYDSVDDIMRDLGVGHGSRQSGHALQRNALACTSCRVGYKQGSDDSARIKAWREPNHWACGYSGER